MGVVRAPMIAIAWMCATAAAVGVSWLGVRTVVHDAVMTPVKVSVPAGSGQTHPFAPTSRLSADPTSTTTPVRTTTTAPSAPPSTSTTQPPAPPTTTTVASDVQRYSLKGGEVVLSMTQTQATLVSATPAAGYSVQAWQESGWLRVDFTAGNATSSLFATWNGHPPSIQTVEQ